MKSIMALVDSHKTVQELVESLFFGFGFTPPEGFIDCQS